MPDAAALTDTTDGLADAREFARSVAGVLDRALPRQPGAWVPGEAPPRPGATGAAGAADAAGAAGLIAALDAIGWDAVAGNRELVACAGLGGIELGRRLAPVWQLDRLLGAAPLAGDLVRSIDSEHPRVLRRGADGVARCRVERAEPCPSAAGLDVHRVLAFGPDEPVDGDAFAALRGPWLAASVGYLAGIGEAALALTVDYTGQRRAFGTTLGALAPVQQRLASAATAVRGVTLLAADEPDSDSLQYAGVAIAEACAACQQVSGAIAFTLEYPLHRHTQLARGLQTFNEALLLDDRGALAA